MDIAAISTIMSQSKVQETASIMIMDKVMDVAKQNGNAINELISESNVKTMDPNLGSIIDKYV